MSKFIYTEDNPLKVCTLCSGYDSQAMSLDVLGIPYELVVWSEIDPYACRAHDAIYPQYADRNVGDMTKVDWSKQPDFDLLTYSTPCFTAGTLVLTNQGYKKIEDITSEDYVLTHTNDFKKVVKPMAKPYIGELLIINAMAFDSLVCTPEHPFYVRKRYKVWDNPNRVYKRLFHKPSWVNAEDLTKDHYLGIAINQNESYPEWNGVEDNRWGHHRISNTLSQKFEWLSFWYIMGRYVGDGWKRSLESSKGIVICCGGRKEDKLVEALNACGFDYHTSKERTVTKYHICCKELNLFVDRYGYYAHGKKIDAETMNLPRPLLEHFLQGYFDADGCFDGIHQKATSVSKELMYGIGQCIAKVYQVPYKIYHTTRKPQTTIEGRVVNQRDSYQIVFKKTRDKQDKAFYEDGYIWFPIKSITNVAAVCQVYNMEVETDNSYTANGCIVHNCQDISTAGKQAGMVEGSDTRSSIIWYTKHAIQEKKPKYLLGENVKNLVGKNHRPEYFRWLQFLEGEGYTNYYAIINAKDCGCPQNRERVFTVSILDDHNIYRFPSPIPLELRLKDILEDEVDDKYVLSETAIQGFLKHNENHKAKGTGFLWVPKDTNIDGGGYANCIRANGAFCPTDNSVIEYVKEGDAGG